MAQGSRAAQPRAHFVGLYPTGMRMVAMAFEVDGRSATVRVSQVRATLRFEFPHFVDETGLSLGDDGRDASLVRQARTVCAVLDATGVWRCFRRGAA